MTKYGQQILDIINKSCDHLSAEQIYQMMKQLDSKIVLATVYNNLNSLVEENKIRRLMIDEDCERYDRIKRHDHLVCSKCGKIEDIFIEDIKDELVQKTGYEFDSYELILHYVCKECRKK